MIRAILAIVNHDDALYIFPAALVTIPVAAFLVEAFYLYVRAMIG
jgi:hypothetical protein